uniref:Uncharacterized protein n=1 Tax=Oryza brachyantha TaxID=4533 RepID=J3M3J0_ORYBR
MRRDMEPPASMRRDMEPSASRCWWMAMASACRCSSPSKRGEADRRMRTAAGQGGSEAERKAMPASSHIHRRPAWNRRPGPRRRQEPLPAIAVVRKLRPRSSPPGTTATSQIHCRSDRIRSPPLRPDPQPPRPDPSSLRHDTSLPRPDPSQRPPPPPRASWPAAADTTFAAPGSAVSSRLPRPPSLGPLPRRNAGKQGESEAAKKRTRGAAHGEQKRSLVAIYVARAGSARREPTDRDVATHTPPPRPSVHLRSDG